jgi:tetratricopeptide (TPR) repeat protein
VVEHRREVFWALVCAALFAYPFAKLVGGLEKSQERLLRARIAQAVATIISYDRNDKASFACGVFVDPNGKLITYSRVLTGSRIEARLQSGAYYKLADALPRDGGSGVTVLQFIGAGIPFADLGNSDELTTGQNVLASISQAGPNCTLSSANIGQPPRARVGATEYIQFTASATAGAGGGLFNDKGQIVGVIANPLRSPEYQQSLSLSLAVPINGVKPSLQGGRPALQQESPEYYYSLGVLAADRREFEKAQQYLEKAISLNPEFAEAHYQLGGVYYELGAYDKELSNYEKAVQYAPENADFSYYLGTAYEDNLMYDHAISQYEHTLRTDPKHKDTLYQLSILYIARGRTDAARALAGRLQTLDPGLAGDITMLLKLMK